MTGKVWLIGAGPSDPGLFTLKGQDILKSADVVVYDRLVGAGILSMIPSNAKKINVGKRAGDHPVPQDEINQILVAEARNGQRVVRLKGGDPFLFGRGGEELELLKQHHIPFEVVPGVTSAIAVAAYNGIPVTHRDYASSVHIITGHKQGDAQYDIDFEALVRTQGTLVFLMGLSALSDICERLMTAGMSSEMPAAVLSQGTTAHQQRVVATVGSLADRTRSHPLPSPAIILVGEVCSLAAEFAWFDKLPLAGQKILITRPRQLISQISQRLRRLGAEVLELPAIKTSPLKTTPEMSAAFSSLAGFDWIAFTSPTGVQIFFQKLQELAVDIRSLSGVRIAALGKGTKSELKKWGLYADLLPEISDGDHLGQEIAAVCRGGERILIPRAAIGGQEIITALQQIEAVEIVDICTYDTEYESYPEWNIKDEFEQGRINYAVFTSASTVRGFAAALPELDYATVTAVCIGPQTRAQAERYGMKTYMAAQATMEEIERLLIQLGS